MSPDNQVHESVQGIGRYTSDILRDIRANTITLVCREIHCYFVGKSPSTIRSIQTGREGDCLE